jgi:predicted transcriptional regulator
MEMAHVPTKQLLQQLITELPDDCTIADVQYRLYVLDAVQRGKDDVAAGRVVPQAQVARELGGRWGRNRVT